MTAPKSQEGKGLGRRKLLTRLGVGGLAVAAATFGGAKAAYAASCGCCNLAHCPPNIAYQSCMSSAAYSWRCYYSNGGIPWQCQCCETSGNSHSAYACWPQ